KSNATKKIYVEDYVMTFIKQLTGEDYSRCKAAVLVGQYVKMENCRSIFIFGAVEVEGIDISNEIVFSNDTWTTIYDNIKKYFTEAEIVGWFLGGPGFMLEDKDKILKAHIDNFAGQDKTMLTYDNLEKEESFLFYENNRLIKLEGYYIYYEKNEEMQNYMIEHNEPQSKEAGYDDRVAREIRTIIQNKKPIAENNKSVTRLMYAAGTLLAVIILVVAASMLNNYDQMKMMQKSLDSLSTNLAKVESAFTGDEINNPKEGKAVGAVTTTEGKTDSSTKGKTAGEGKASNQSLDINVVSGDVKPIDKDEAPTSGEELVGGKKEDKKDSEDKEEKEDKIDKAEHKEEDESEDQASTSEDNSEEEAEDNSEEEAEDSGKETQEETKYYTVVSGDSLIGISYKLYHSANYISKIMELNNIEDEDMIIIGQKLIVP
ncbi:MAG TPA: LysM peptidoglycan-binding domain-containing protein, partial [Anaerovoracaceae bacterium]|nr:LysM peptidoglycan-binding domain-containing protein [Anaerovoracaceae bacterium]